MRAWKEEEEMTGDVCLFQQPIIRAQYGPQLGMCPGVCVCMYVHVLQVRSSLSIIILS